MRKLMFIFIIFLVSLSTTSALCEEGQIDVNTASNEKLDELYGIGPVKAEAIIDSRPFDSINELINVYGIGEITLNKIKEQGLACVNGKTEGISESDLIQKEIVEKEKEEVTEEEKEIINPEIKEVEMISLTTKTIKSQDNKENKSNYAVWGFVAFCVLLVGLFILKKKKYKNEFR